MARFYGDLVGERGKATKIGRQQITGHIRGWHTGVRVWCHADPKTDKDICEIFRTGGSSASERDELVAIVSEDRIRFVKKGR